MNDQFSKFGILLTQGRYDLARREIQRALADNPNEAILYSLLALCSIEDEAAGQLEQATEIAQRAIALDPAEPFAHYVMSLVWDRRGQTQLASECINEAIRLDPDSADYFAALARYELILQRYQASLQAADQGLRLDAEHIDCANYRSLALERLGKTEDAVTASRENLRRNPDNAGTHVAHGHALLHSGRHQEAQVAFREALRLDPNNEFARVGLMQALNSRSFVFRTVNAYFVWISRFAQRTGFLIVFGAWILIQVLGRAANAIPALQLFVLPIIILYVLFAVMTWTAGPLFNTFLRFHPFGKHLLKPLEFWASNLIAVTLSLSVFGAAVGLWFANPGSALLLSFYWLLLMTAVAASLSMQTIKRRLAFAGLTIGVALIPVFAFSKFAIDPTYDPLPLANNFWYGILGIQIASQFVMAQPVTR